MKLKPVKAKAKAKARAKEKAEEKLRKAQEKARKVQEKVDAKKAQAEKKQWEKLCKKAEKNQRDLDRANRENTKPSKSLNSNKNSNDGTVYGNAKKDFAAKCLALNLKCFRNICITYIYIYTTLYLSYKIFI